MKILVVRVGRVGDVVMITSALTALLDKYPLAEIQVLTSPDGKRVLAGYDDRVAKTIVYDRKALNALLMRRRIRRLIKNEGYTHIYCFELNPSFYGLFKDLSAQVHALSRADEGKHYARRCVRVVDPAWDKEAWVRLPVSEQAREKARAMLAEVGVTEDTYVIGFHPSFSGLKKSFFRGRKHYRNKRWPAESFAALGRMLMAYAEGAGLNMRIVMDLLPDERALGESIAAGSGGNIVVLTPPPDFDRYKAMLARMDLLVTPDTGPMHVAAAVGTRLVALFFGKDPGECGPYVSQEQFIALRAEDMAVSADSIAAIAPEVVLEACKRFLPA